MPTTLHSLHADILVAGGGPAGLCCALAAARQGARVILCQDRPVLGGNASSEIRMHIVGANGIGGSERGSELETEAREGGLIEEIRLENSVRNPQRSSSMSDLILYELCRAEPNLTLLLNTTLTAATVEGGKITTARAERQSTEDLFDLTADIFIDCTGDGRLGYEAGAPFMEGRESRAQTGESLARETQDPHRLGSTLLLMARRHDRPMPFEAPAWARSFSKEDLRLRLYANPGDEAPSHEYGYWWAEWGGTLDTIKDNEAIRDELLAVVLGIWNHVKNGPPGTPAGEDPFDASHWALDWFGFLPGKRESRRFVGQHVLTEDDLVSSRPFPDAIAYGGWALDLHPPEGVDAPDLEPCVHHPVPHLYDIPLSACLSQTIPNLLFAGRNLSATHVAFASTRVMATCGAVGQGVGTAAAHAIHQGISPAELPNRPADLAAIQRQLLLSDAHLLGAPFPAGELVERATLRASSAQPDSPPEAVRSRQTRSTHGSRGAPTGRRHPGTHRWRSDPAQGLPAWLELTWEEPVSLCEIRLIFDTGQHRHLTLSLHDGYTSQMQWGMAQPETVRDYRLEGRIGSTWHLLHEEKGNYQRLRVHPLAPPGPVEALRLTITATNGLDHARLNGLHLRSEPYSEP